MTKAEKSAICRILFDLIQADSIIDSKEIEHFLHLREKYNIAQEDEITASQITFADAITIISNSDYELKKIILQDCSDMTTSDGFCARSEALVMFAINSKLNTDDVDVDVISIKKTVFNIESASVLYIESRCELAINEIILKNYRTISKECQIAGFNFVYIPRIIAHYKESNPKLIKQIIHFLAPNFSNDGVDTIINGLLKMTTRSFCKDILCNKLGVSALRDTAPALLIKIGHSYVGETIYANYLKLEVDKDLVSELQRRHDEFLSMLSSDFISVKTSEEKQKQFLYHGFYKQLLDIFLIRKSIRSRVLIQPYTEEIIFPDIDQKLDKLHRREKALYVFLLMMSKDGGINFNQPKTTRQFDSFNRKMQLIQEKYQIIYSAFGGEKDKAPDLRQPEIRRPIISCLKKSLSRLEEALYNFNDYTISKDKYGYLKIGLESNLLYYFSSGVGYIQIFETELFDKVNMIK